MTRIRSKSFDPGHDELQLFEAMLKDKFVNHELDTIIKDFQIIRLQVPEMIDEFPGIRFYMGGWRDVAFGEQLDEDDNPIDEITKIIVLEIFMREDQGFKYHGKVYQGMENCILVIRDIIYRIISEQQGYPTSTEIPADPDIVSEYTDICFDILTPESEMWKQMFQGMEDASSLLIGVRTNYEKVRL